MKKENSHNDIDNLILYPGYDIEDDIFFKEIERRKQDYPEEYLEWVKLAKERVSMPSQLSIVTSRAFHTPCFETLTLQI